MKDLTYSSPCLGLQLVLFSPFHTWRNWGHRQGSPARAELGFELRQSASGALVLNDSPTSLSPRANISPEATPRGQICTVPSSCHPLFCSTPSYLVWITLLSTTPKPRVHSPHCSQWPFKNVNPIIIFLFKTFVFSLPLGANLKSVHGLRAFLSIPYHSSAIIPCDHSFLVTKPSLRAFTKVNFFLGLYTCQSMFLQHASYYSL